MFILTLSQHFNILIYLFQILSSTPRGKGTRSASLIILSILTAMQKVSVAARSRRSRVLLVLLLDPVSVLRSDDGERGPSDRDLCKESHSDRRGALLRLQVRTKTILHEPRTGSSLSIKQTC